MKPGLCPLRLGGAGALDGRQVALERNHQDLGVQAFRFPHSLMFESLLLGGEGRAVKQVSCFSHQLVASRSLNLGFVALAWNMRPTKFIRIPGTAQKAKPSCPIHLLTTA